MTGLSLKNISAGYGRADIISGISAEAAGGKLIALIGPNGSGKTTLMKALAGLLPISAGEIWVGNTPLSFLEPRERAKSIAYLAQDRTAMPSMTVADILELGRAPYRGRLGKISPLGNQAIGIAIRSTHLESHFDHPFGELSGGEQARVLLARALVVDAPVMLADEPNAALDPFFQITTMEILKDEAARGKTVIAALHDLRLAKTYADQVWVMEGGHLVANGTPERAMSSEILEKVFRLTADHYMTQT